MPSYQHEPRHVLQRWHCYYARLHYPSVGEEARFTRIILVTDVVARLRRCTDGREGAVLTHNHDSGIDVEGIASQVARRH